MTTAYNNCYPKFTSLKASVFCPLERKKQKQNVCNKNRKLRLRFNQAKWYKFLLRHVSYGGNERPGDNVPSIRPKPVYCDCSYDSHTCISI